MAASRTFGSPRTASGNPTCSCTTGMQPATHARCFFFLYFSTFPYSIISPRSIAGETMSFIYTRYFSFAEQLRIENFVQQQQISYSIHFCVCIESGGPLAGFALVLQSSAIVLSAFTNTLADFSFFTHTATQQTGTCIFEQFVLDLFDDKKPTISFFQF